MTLLSAQQRRCSRANTSMWWRPVALWLSIVVCGVLMSAPGWAQPAPADPAPADGAPAADAPADPPDAAPAAGPKPLSETLKGVAKAEYEAARILFSDGDYKNSIVKFQRTHELSKDPRLLWNIAVCQKFLRQYSKMLISIRRYQKEAKDMLTPEDRQQADEIVETVKGFITDLKLTVDQSDAQVFVDGEMVGVSPLVERITMDVGNRTLTVRKDGFKTDERQITVPGGGEIKVDVRMVKDLHRGRLVVVAGERDVISIDGKVVGQSKYQGSLPSGPHTLKVSAADMAAYQSEVVIEDDKERRIEVTLNPLATDPTATILWIVGGATLAAGGAVAAAFIFQPDTGPSVDGTINPGSVQLGSPYASQFGTRQRFAPSSQGIQFSTPLITVGSW